MFNRYKSLKNIDLSKFKTKNVISMLSIFWGCKTLIYLNLSNFNTENVL